MFGMSTVELIVVLIVALVVLGPDHLPALARSLGRMMREFRKATNEIQTSLEVEDVRRTLRERVEQEKAAILSVVDVDGGAGGKEKEKKGDAPARQGSRGAPARAGERATGSDAGSTRQQGKKKGALQHSEEEPEPELEAYLGELAEAPAATPTATATATVTATATDKESEGKAVK